MYLCTLHCFSPALTVILTIDGASRVPIVDRTEGEWLRLSESKDQTRDIFVLGSQKLHDTVNVYLC